MIAGHPCPVGCGRLLPFRTAVCCKACWARLPEDLKAPIAAAQRAKAPHRMHAPTIAARQWLKNHPVGFDRRTGETE